MPKLRAVTPNERAHKKMTVIDAADHGTHPDLLRALKARIATAIQDPNGHPRDIAALSRQLLEVSKELEATAEAGTEGDPVGQAAATADEPWQGV
jgi:DNA-binding NtrC family response regulator